jgi:hypothetical protein
MALTESIMHETATLYVVVDTITTGIFCSTPCAQLAHALRLYSVRVTIKPAGYGWGGHIKPEYQNINLNDPAHTYGLANSNGIWFPALSLSAQQQQDFQQFRQRLLLVKHYHAQLIDTARIAQENSQAANPLLVKYLDTIMYELSKCTPETAQYTDAIQSYAQVSGCTPEAAWQELQLSVEGVSHARLRNLALYTRYRNAINSSPADPDALDDIMYQAGQDFYSRASV